MDLLSSWIHYPYLSSSRVRNLSRTSTLADRLKIFRYAWWITAKVNMSCLSFALTDNAQTATPIDNPVRSGLCQPDMVRAPEVTLKYPWTSAIDIWTIGCLVGPAPRPARRH
jgi:hypothetical protein